MSQRADEPRAEGPPVVDSGDPKRPRLLVLDPAGAGKHGEPPASWQGIADAAHVTWLRLPAIDAAVATAREKLAELSASGLPVHLLAAGEAAQLAELLALERPGALRSLLLVDPAEPSGDLVGRGTTVVEEALLAYRTTPVEQVLAGHGVELHVVTFRDAERADRGAPLPLGHPEVVDAVRRALVGEPLASQASQAPNTADPTGEHTVPDRRTRRAGARRHGTWHGTWGGTWGGFWGRVWVWVRARARRLARRSEDGV